MNRLNRYISSGQPILVCFTTEKTNWPLSQPPNLFDIRDLGFVEDGFFCRLEMGLYSLRTPALKSR